MQKDNRNTMDRMRENLMSIMDDLVDPKEGQDTQEIVQRANAMTDVGKVLVDSAKVEVDFMKASGLSIAPTRFLETDVTKKRKELDE